MAHIVAIVAGIDINETGSMLELSGEARTGPGNTLAWKTQVAFTASPAVINNAIMDAAIASAAAAGIIVGGGDNKIIIAGASQ